MQKNFVVTIMIENWLEKLENWLEKYRLNYHRLRLKLKKNPRDQVCECCNFHGWTNIHHWRYAYTYTQIRDNNALALENTTELCFPCHLIGNAMRILFEKDPYLQLKTSEKTLSKLLKLREKALKTGAKNEK